MAQIFKKLTPISNADMNQSHIEAMDFAVTDEEILNVAISGNYGSGKSSFVETYKTNYNPTKKTFLHISLAHFNSEDGETGKAQENLNSQQLNKKDSILEGKIVNQLLHQIDSDKIPLTIFKSKQAPTTKQIFYWTAKIFIFVLLTVILLNMREELKGGNPWLLFLAVILTVDIWIIINQLTKQQLQGKLFKSVSLKSGPISTDIEILGNSKTSYFDQYLDDVLYLFDNCQADIIVFEDLDRFETNVIFSKLKEINTLVNNKRRARGNKDKLLFMYLIKDDMFISKERTKFFDFIIPIIPAVTSSNSREKFSEILSELNCKNDLGASFLQKISIYIDDMRLTNNICNEYVLYKSNLTEEGSEDNLELSKEKLFGLVVYKNVFPKDFSELQRNSGFLYRVFQEKERLKLEKLGDIDIKVSEIEEKIRAAEKEALENELELYSSILKIPENRAVLKVNDKFEFQFDNRLDYIAELLKEDAKIVSYKYYSDAHYQQSTYSETSENLFPILEKTKQRLETIRNKSQIKSLNNELEDCQKERQAIQLQKLADLITREDIDAIASEPEFKYIISNPQFSMIIFLLRNRYIDESYPDYITYFYANSLTREDKEFIMAVQGEEKLAWDYQLTNYDEIHSRLDTSDYERDEILNYNLFAHLMTQNSVPDSEKRLKSFFVEKRLEFIISFFQHIRHSQAGQVNIVLDILDYNPELLNVLLTSDEFLNEVKYSLFQRILFYVDLSSQRLDTTYIELISKVVSDNWLQIWDQHTATRENKYDERVLKNLTFLKVKLVEFGFKSEYGLVINEGVYENNLYQMNSENVLNLVRYLDPSLSDEDIKEKNFTLIHSEEKFNHLLNYVTENMEDYIKLVVNLSDGYIADELKYIYDILNDTNLSEETKVSYLKLVKENILEISQITDMGMIKEAVKLKKIVFNTANVLAYFKIDYSWTDILLDFVNPQTIFNIDKKLFSENDEEFQKEFFKQTVECNDLEDRHYKAILSSLSFARNILPKDLSSNKVSILIETGTISSKFDEDILLDLKSDYSECAIPYILRYLDSYIEQINNHYDEDELLKILDSNIPHDKAQAIIDEFKNPISITDKNYSSYLLAYIIENKFDEEELSELLNNYQSYESPVQKAIEDKANESLNVILYKDYPVDEALLMLMMKNTDTDLEDRRLLYSRNIKSDDDVKRVLNNLKLVDLSETYERLIQEVGEHKNPKIEVTDYNENLLNFLRKADYINSFSKDSNNDSFYRIYSSRKGNSERK